MNAGKKWVEEEKAASIESGKQCIEDVQKIFPSNPGTSLLDFFPFLKWFGYKGEEESVIKVYKERDEFLQGLIEEVKRKETSSDTSNPAEGVKHQTTVIESLLALQKSDPELYTDEVVKGTMACFEWERVGQELVDMSIVDALISVQKAKPLEAICAPRPFTTTLISPP
ncbi:hypothetical protein D5086_030084 [Populus alba]|uniref:Uncharacterized protein n=1 Tax=Populus alba TaxID=43335 RepID=A0ACC4AMG7_POPAL